MKTMSLIQTAAAAILMTGTAFLMTGTAAAQSPMTANVPFSFTYGGVNLPAGEYRIDTSRSLSSGVVLIQNSSTNQAVARIGSPANANPTDNPRLVFRCGESSGCILSQVWSLTGEQRFSLPKGADTQYTASIPMNAVKAD